MRRTLTSKTKLESLRKEAKRWLKALRAGDADATNRLKAASPKAPPIPGLRDIQHAMALEYGVSGWVALKAALAEIGLASPSDADRLDTLLRHGWSGDVGAAERILARHPELARDSLYTAASCGLIGEVEKHLARDPGAATRTGGAMEWTALAYVTYGRLDPENAVPIARMLLAAGAEPRFSFNDGWDNPFTLICGAIGLGEQNKPTHRQAAELVELLIDAGADAYDRQTLYNISVSGDDPDWYERLSQYCERQGVTEAWAAPDGGFLGKTMLDYLLGNAMGQNHVARAQWLLDHGADADTTHAYTKEPLHKLTQLSGFHDLALLLEAHGARPVRLTGIEALIAAALRNDEPAVRAMLADNSDLIRDPHPLLAAAVHGSARATALLLAAGADPRGVDAEGISPLHRAVQAGSISVADLLLDAGADVDLREKKWKGTPLGWAVVLRQPHLAERLAPLSRDVRALASLPAATRLEAVLAAEPALANHRLDTEDAPTPLYCLPDEDEAAAEIAEILLRHGADPNARNGQGQSPADAARRRGLDDAADLIEEAAHG
ncbi:MAG: ankyrin repeat domain-containing protein [Sphingomonas sp.]|nr:ankyrin repeat domain-containing protein [Sphingomonas sp.]